MPETQTTPEVKRGVRFQLFQVTVLPQGQLRSVKRSASAATRRKAVPKNVSKHVMLFGRTLEGTSVHVQLIHPAGFWLRLPFKWTAREAKAIAAALGASAVSFELRSNFIGFTPHVPGNTNYDEPQRLPFAWLTFASDEKANKTYQSLRGYHGARKSGYVWDSVLRKAGFSGGALQGLHLQDLSVHDFADGEADLFDRINTHLRLAKPNLATYESWITLADRVAWLPEGEYFANSDRNAHIRLSDIVAVENTLELAPMSLLSYDVEQFSHTAADTGERGFPNSGCWQDHIEQIACSFTPDTQSLTAPPPRTTVFVRQAAKFRDLADPVVQNMDIVVCGSEAELLLRWAREVRERQPDILTGYGLVVFDNKAVFYRAYLFFLCQTLSFESVATMWRKAQEFVPKFEDMMAESAAGDAKRKEGESSKASSKASGKASGKASANASTKVKKQQQQQLKTGTASSSSSSSSLFCGTQYPTSRRERDDLMRQWFGIAQNSPASECRAPPLAFLVLHTVPDMDAAAYDYFHAGPRIDMFFFFGKVPTWEIGFASSMYSTAAAGELPQEFFSNVGFAQLCGWYMMKKSYGGLAKFGLADVMAKFCPSMPKLADMPYNLMFAIIERGNDPEQLGDVARCACVLTVLTLLKGFVYTHCNYWNHCNYCNCNCIVYTMRCQKCK